VTTITDAAAEVTRNVLRRTSVPKPVVHLIEITKEKDVPSEVASAFRVGASEESTRDGVARLMQLPKLLIPAIYHQTPFRWLFSKKIDGLLFFCPPGLRAEMSGATLDVAERGLVLKDAHGAIVRPKPRGV
jgi:hypothetical protein